MEIRSVIKIYLYILSKMCYDVANIFLPLCFDYASCKVFLCITMKMPEEITYIVSRTIL